MNNELLLYLFGASLVYLPALNMLQNFFSSHIKVPLLPNLSPAGLINQWNQRTSPGRCDKRCLTTLEEKNVLAPCLNLFTMQIQFVGSNALSVSPEGKRNIYMDIYIKIQW